MTEAMVNAKKGMEIAEAAFRLVVATELPLGARVAVLRRNCRTGDYWVYGKVVEYDGAFPSRIYITNLKTGKRGFFYVTCDRWERTGGGKRAAKAKGLG